MLHQILFAVFLISTVIGYPVENEQQEVKGYMQQMLESAGLYQGDIMLTEEQQIMLRMKTGLINEKYRWPNRVVPYLITAGHFSQSDLNVIQIAMNEIQRQTCIRFRQRTANDKDYIRITSTSKGCFSYIGRIGGAQQLNLQRPGCVSQGVAIHEMIHAVGFEHMQQATDRDNYVIINWKNIQKGQKHNFDIQSPNRVNHFGGSYDYNSVMHYDRYAFSGNGQQTIVPRDPKAQIGDKPNLSQQDIMKIKNMYKC